MCNQIFMLGEAPLAATGWVPNAGNRANARDVSTSRDLWRYDMIRIFWLLPVFALTLLAACGSDSKSEADAGSDGGDNRTPGGGDAETGEFAVDSVEILQLESFPVQIVVQAKGTFPDGCTEIDEVDVQQEGNEYVITITTTRPTDTACTEAIVEHSEGVNIGSPEPGDYTATVNGVSEDFTVDGSGTEPGEGQGSDGAVTPGGGNSSGPADPNGTSAICAEPSSDPDQSVSSDDPPPCDDTIDENDYTFGSFNVESVDVLTAESFPVQIFVAATGYFPDGCTEVHEVTVEQSGNDYTITITTRRPTDAICTQALVEHTESVGLGSPPPGDYTATVNGVSSEFTVAG